MKKIALILGASIILLTSCKISDEIGPRQPTAKGQDMYYTWSKAMHDCIQTHALIGAVMDQYITSTPAEQQALINRYYPGFNMTQTSIDHWLLSEIRNPSVMFNIAKGVEYQITTNKISNYYRSDLDYAQEAEVYSTMQQNNDNTWSFYVENGSRINANLILTNDLKIKEGKGRITVSLHGQSYNQRPNQVMRLDFTIDVPLEYDSKNGYVAGELSIIATNQEGEQEFVLVSYEREYIVFTFRGDTNRIFKGF